MGDIHADTRINIERKIINNHALQVRDSRNYKVLKRIIFNNDIYPGLLSVHSDNSSILFSKDLKANKINAEVMLNNDSIIYYLLEVDSKIAGFCAWMLLDNKKNYVTDIGIYKKFRGNIGYNLGRMSLEKFKREVEHEMIYASIREDNRSSLFYAQAMGFKKLFQKNGFICLG